MSFFIYLILLSWSQCCIWRNGERLWTQVINLYPRAYPAHVARADYYLRKHETGKAAADLNQALAFQPDYFDALRLKGNVFMLEGNYSQAIVVYTDALLVQKNSVEVLNNRGASYLLSGKYLEAEHDYNQSIALGPDQVAAYYNRGELFYRQGRYPESLKDFQVVLLRNPSFEDTQQKIMKIMKISMPSH